MGICASVNSSSTMNDSHIASSPENSKSAGRDVTRLRGSSGSSNNGSIQGRDPSLELDDDARAGLIGLRNLGNTCYMNSALQCLSHTVPLADYFLNCNWKEEINVDNPLGTKGVLATAYAELLDKLWRGDKSVHSPKKFKRKLGQYNEQFQGYDQHDSQELITFLLDGLHEDLNRVSKKPYVEDPECDGRPEEIVAAESWKGYLLRNKSIVVDLFQGQLRSSLTCGECGYKRVKFDPFMYLSVPIPTSKSRNTSFTLDECVKEFSKEEELTGDAQWYCSKCKKHVDATKKFDIWKVPPVFIIQIKRFTYTKSGRPMKMSSKVLFKTEKWNVKKHVKSPQREMPIYDLFAISNHHGGFGSGHYTAFAKGRDRDHVDNGYISWHHFNDSQFEHVDDPSDIQTSDAYVLFYNKMTNVRKNGDIKYSRQSISLPHLWPHLQGLEGGGGGGGGGGGATLICSTSANRMTPQKVNVGLRSASMLDWTEHTTIDDEGNERKYYHSAIKGVTTWVKPPEFD
jgi:ubiquitin carboxyl-terminal hydrolase 8